MTASMVFIIVSIVFDVIVIVAANVWALRDGPPKALATSADQLWDEIHEVLETQSLDR
jgi:hypothetical protein